MVRQKISAWPFFFVWNLYSSETRCFSEACSFSEGEENGRGIRMGVNFRGNLRYNEKKKLSETGGR